MWVFNSEHGEVHMHGWLFKQGNWGWACAITWHIVDLGLLDEPYAPSYYWVAYLWKWSQHAGWQSNLILSDGSVQGSDVEPWMVHTDGWW